MDKKPHEVTLQMRRLNELHRDEMPGGRETELPRALPEPQNMHPSSLRRISERRVVHLLLRATSLTRVELARQTGLSVATIGKIIDSLVSAGIVERVAAETRESGPTLGRPAEYFGVSRSRRRYVVVELGVRTIQMASLPIAGPVGDIPTAHFKTSSDWDVLERRMRSAVDLLDISDPLAVLVSVPGVVNEAERRILYSPNLHWTEGTKLFDTISRAVPGKLVVVQDVRALALGYLVHSDPQDSYLLVDTNDGVGGALVMNGALLGGPLPLAGEIGHTAIHGNQRACGCGGVGCLETLLARGGLLRTAQENFDNSLDNWADLVAASSRHGFPTWASDALSDAAQVIAGALNTVGVSKAVISGDLLELGSGVLDFMTEQINAHALWGRFGKIRVEAAPRRRLLGLTSAALDRVVLAVDIASSPASKSEGERAV